MSNNPYILFNRLILFTVEAYLTKSKEDGHTDDEMHNRLISGIRAYQTMGRFSQEEAKLLQELGETETAKKIKQKEISFVVYALELMKLWIEEVPVQYRKSIYLGVSNKKLKLGRATFAMGMLRLKKEDKERYDNLKEIIDESVINAKHFFGYFQNELVKKAK